MCFRRILYRRVYGANNLHSNECNHEPSTGYSLVVKLNMNEIT